VCARNVFERRLLFCEWHWCVDFRAEREREYFNAASLCEKESVYSTRECVFDKRVCCNGAFREFCVDLARFSNRRVLQRAFCFTVLSIVFLARYIEERVWQWCAFIRREIVSFACVYSQRECFIGACVYSKRECFICAQ
jgi:hypothetical protein